MAESNNGVTTTTPLLAAKPAAASRSTAYAFSCVVLAAVATVLMGYNVAVMSGAEMYLTEDLGLTDTQIEVLSGSVNIFSLLGALPAGWTSDLAGRRVALAVANALFLASSVTMSLARGYVTLMAGRFLAGVGVSYAMVTAPVYVAEVSPASLRGLLGSITEIFINVGVVLSYISNYAFSALPFNLGWRLMFAAGAVPPVFVIAGVLLIMAESPRWLVLRGRDDEARHVLQRLSGDPNEADALLADIQETARRGATSSASPGGSVWKELFHLRRPSTVRIVASVLALQFFQQSCGVQALILYSPTVYKSAGMTSNQLVLAATVVTAVFKVGSIFVAMFLIDTFGRRPLLLGSSAGMTFSMFALGMFLLAGRGGAATSVACVVAVAAYYSAFSIGIGPLASLYSSEILPLRLRASGLALGAMMNRTSSAVVSMTFISLYEAITMAGNFFLYSGITAALLVFVYFCLPETRGRTLEDIETHFTSGTDE